MKTTIVLLVASMLCGCVAVVDDSGSKRRVEVYGTTEEDVIDTLRQGEEKSPEEKKEIIIFESKKVEQLPE